MKLSVRHDIDAAQRVIFDALSDVERYERRARASGAEVTRLDDQNGPLDTARWQITFTYRGRKRSMNARVVKVVPPDLLVMTGHVDGLDLTLELHVLSLAATRTRVIATVDLRPTTLSSRLLVQSLKLAKAALTKRMQKRLATFAEQIETGQIS